MAVVFLPFLGLFAKLLVKLVPEKAEEKKFGPMYLDDHVLGTPSLALGQATREALRTSDIVREMLTEMIRGLRSDDPAIVEDITRDAWSTCWTVRYGCISRAWS
jgi:phosphate:Na+ symporter